MMTVEELIEELRMLPPTARIAAKIRKNLEHAGSHTREPNLEELYEWREADIDTAVYDGGTAFLQLDE